MSTYALAFALGLLYGRKRAAQIEVVEPVLVFLPPPRKGIRPDVSDKQFLDQLAKDMPSELASQILERLKALESLRSFAEIALEVERCYWVLRSSSKALEEGRISSRIYRFITRRYLMKLSELHPRLNESRVRAEGEVRRVLGELLTAWVPASTSLSGSSM